MSLEMDEIKSDSEFSEQPVDLFLRRGLKEAAIPVARLAVDPSGLHIAELKMLERDDKEIAQALSKVVVVDAHYQQSTSNIQQLTDEQAGNVALVALAKIESVKREQPKFKAKLEKFEDKVLDSLGNFLSRAGGKKALATTAGLSLALTACGNTVNAQEPVKPVETAYPVATEVMPTTAVEPTQISEPTEIAPKATSEAEPSPIQEYIGLPAAEVETLRQQCLAQNPDSLCLPLPVDPTLPEFSMRVVEFVKNYFIQGQKYEVAETYLSIRLPQGVEVQAPLGGNLTLYLTGNPGENASTAVILLGPALENPDFPQRPVAEVYLDFRRSDGLPFEDGDATLVTSGGGQVSAGETLFKTGRDNLVLGVWHYGAETLPNGDPIYSSHFTLGNLLRDTSGKFVYTLP